ncbi:type IVa pilus pseudopilin TppD [Aeromonas veronii]|uniref:type IVa pilus pseudopilin TppD n=1 Tax=Aeromonas veronii TaxID=654 RepID=UPI0032EF4CEE
MKRQRGVALIVALIILVPLTLIAVVVMQSSGQDLKMAGSAAIFRQAEHRLEGIIEAAMQSNNVSTLISNMGASAAITVNSSNASAAVALTTRTETVCKRKVEASSSNVIPACKYVELQTSVNYGKYASQLNWVAGVEQPLLTK